MRHEVVWRLGHWEMLEVALLRLRKLIEASLAEFVRFVTGDLLGVWVEVHCPSVAWIHIRLPVRGLHEAVALNRIYSTGVTSNLVYSLSHDLHPNQAASANRRRDRHQLTSTSESLLRQVAGLIKYLATRSCQFVARTVTCKVELA